MEESQWRELSDFHVIGISYKKTPIEVRQTFYLHKNTIQQFFEEASAFNLNGIIALSTCNRTEIYVNSSCLDIVEQLFIQLSGGTPAEFEKYNYVYSGKKAVEHLFRVCSGLDSQILGDYEITGQVKEAYFLSLEAGMLNSFMNKLFQLVFQAGKKIKTSTHLSTGSASVGFHAAKYVEKYPEKKNILLVGVGQIGKITCKNIVKFNKDASIVLVNRTKEKAYHLSREMMNVQVSDFEELPSNVKDADVIILATNSKDPVLLKSMFETDQEKIILDLSVPSNLDPEIKQLAWVTVVDIDQVSLGVQETYKTRENSIPAANSIIDEYVGEFLNWLSNRHLYGTFKFLQEKLEEVKNQEINKHENDLTKEELILIDKISSRIMKRISRFFINYIKNHQHDRKKPVDIVKGMFEIKKSI